MNTSYFAKNAKHPNAVAISLIVPEWFKGRQYRKLAPSWDIFNNWKKNGSDALYTKQYKWEILGTLDPLVVYEELGPNAVMLCYEGKGKFCHRHIVAEWLNEALRKQGIVVTEL